MKFDIIQSEGRYIMQQKTSSRPFLKYGSVYNDPIDIAETNLICSQTTIPAKRNISQLYCFDCPVCVEIESGMASILIGETPDSSSLETFAIHRQVKINAGLYFEIVAVTANTTYKLFTEPEYSYTVEELSPPYKFDRVLPRIRISEILGYFYNIRNAGYRFLGEVHNHYELTYVDRGCMDTVIDGQLFHLHEHDLILYGPGQFHTQFVPMGESCSYATIIFDMDIIAQDDPVCVDSILNKSFPYNKKLYTLIKTFINESSTQLPYMNSLMLCLLQEIIIRLLQSEFTGEKEDKPVTEVRQYYQDTILQKILDYINSNITKPLTIAEICQAFSLSRSSLQILFKENLNQTPKKYISELKLEKSCELLRENKYTVSEISLMLGFNSIHYFSRAFTQKYGISPSEYAKQIFK